MMTKKTLPLSVRVTWVATPSPMGQFITPDVLPPTTYCRRLLIPNDPKWIGAVSGALLPMMHASEWVSFGGITPEEAAERAAVMLNQYWTIESSCEDDMACCDDQVKIHRFNPDTGRAEISLDDGVTWQGDPADTQNQINLLPPLVKSGGGKTRCDAATNGSEHINELITATAENLTTAETVFQLAVGIAEAILGLFLILISAGTLTAPVTLVATSIWAAATALFGLGISAYNAYWTVDKQDLILCLLYCYIGSDGQFTESQYQDWREAMKAQLPASPAFDIVMTAINAGGARGLSQMCSYGNAAEADCSSCDCPQCIIDDWSVSLWYGGTYFPEGDSNVKGIEVARGDDWIIIQSQDRGDGQQVLSMTTAGGTKACGFTTEWVGDSPAHALHFFNYAPNHANYLTQTQDETNPFGAPFTQFYMQMDPGTWLVKLTLTT